MIITPSIRQNFFTNAHPEGCKKNIENQIKDVKSLGVYKGPKNVLIIGGSSGYGLSSRISLAYGSNANTVNVSFESTPRGKRTGSAGYWNNAFFQHFAMETGNKHKDFIGDAFSQEMKQDVLTYIKDELGTIDLLIYSLAAGARKDYTTGETVRSHIKSLGKDVVGKTIDISSEKIKDLTVESGSEQDAKDTVFVMGGSDWQDWVTVLKDAEVLNDGFKTVAYTYIGGSTTEAIYRKGTMGQAKEDLENKAFEMNKLLSKELQGEALVSSSKAVVTKASVFIPQMPIYVSCLYDVMERNGTHESILEHKHRLFKDMIYGDKRILDEKNRVRLDHLEMESQTQKETLDLMFSLNNDQLMKLDGTKEFLKEFYQINGFNIEDVNYEDDIDITLFKEQFPIK